MARSNKSGIKFSDRSVFFSKDGYPQIKLNNKSQSVHRVVWTQHFGEIPKHLTVNHIDGDKMNWDISNLELLSQGDNVRHAWSIGLCNPKKGQDHGRAKLDDEKVMAILSMPKRKPNGHKPGWSDQELADIYGVSKTRIGNIRNGKEWKHLSVKASTL